MKKELDAPSNKLIDSVMSLLRNILTTDDEESFFEDSAEIMRVCAVIIENSKFAKSNQKIPYAIQAIEYSVEQLNERLTAKKLSIYYN
jgi:hypothetical protein